MWVCVCECTCACGCYCEVFAGYAVLLEKFRSVVPGLFLVLMSERFHQKRRERISVIFLSTLRVCDISRTRFTIILDINNCNYVSQLRPSLRYSRMTNDNHLVS